MSGENFCAFQSKDFFGYCQHATRSALVIGCLLLFAFTIEAEATKYAYRPKSGICGAAVDGDVVRLKAFLTADPTAISERDRGATPLHWAARCGHREVVILLLTNGADVDAKADDNSTPLHWAVRSGQSGVVKAILEKRPDVNAAGKDGATPLWCACNYNFNIDIVRLLLDRKADANTKDQDGVTALQAASFHGVLGIVKLLLEHGAIVNSYGYKGATALHWAVDGRQKATVVFLLKQGAQVNAVDESNRTPLRWAQDESVNEGWWARRRLRQISDLLRQNGGTVLSGGQQSVQTNKNSAIRSE